MTRRLDYQEQSPELFNGPIALCAPASRSNLERTILHLFDVRASQINGRAFRIDVHPKAH